MSIGGSSKLGRRGMSPLIATVLLMAFAVALGGMIMNWSVDTGGQSGDCELIKIQVQRFCAEEDRIILSMRNDPGSVPLQGIKLNLIESSIESTLNIKNSGLSPGQPLEISIPAVTSLNTKVAILGVVGSAANPLTCTQELGSADPLQKC